MDHPQRPPSGDTSNAPSASSNLMPSVLFREIHKNAFLKRHSSDRRAGFPRKSERVWVVFCVHDDTEPFLEIYPDQKVALTHKPEWFASLSNVLHVSPTICGHEDEYEFAITLSFQVVRLSAPSWEAMMEWVETIRNKLRELKVLCPKENIYSKMPEQKQPLLPTRDPNSPLPLPPEGPSTFLPGIEIVHVENRVNPLAPEAHENGRHRRISHSRNNEPDRRVINSRINQMERGPNSVLETIQLSESSNMNIAGAVENPVEGPTISDSNQSQNQTQESKVRVRKAASASQASSSSSVIGAASNITVIEVSTPSQSDNNAPSESNHSDSENNEIFGNSNNHSPNEETASKSNAEATHYEHVFLSNVPMVKAQTKAPVNCIPVNVNRSKKTHSANLLISTSSATQNSSQDNSIASTSNTGSSSNSKDVLGGNSSCMITSKNSVAEECERGNKSPLSPQIQSKLERVNITGLIPRVPAKSVKVSSFKPASPLPKDLNLNIPECKKYSVENERGFLPSAENLEVLTNGECSLGASASGISIPAYSQVKKVPKGKAKNEENRNEEHLSSQKASPVIPKRKATEGQMLEVETEGNRKPENVAVPKNQPNSLDAKVFPQTKTSGISKQEGGGGNSNSELLRNFPVGPGNEQRILEGPSTSGNPSQLNLTRKESMTTPNINTETEPIDAVVQPPVGVISVEDIPLIGGHQRRRRRSSSDSAPSSATQSSRGIGGADRIRINPPINSAREVHRYDNDMRPCRNRNGTEPNSVLSSSSQSARLTLREKQVLQLKKEILHPGGIRLQLRKKDCAGSIALVDVLNGVWVAGWKQKEHPLLYNALHIGDQLISVGDAVVRNSAEAQKLIRSSTRPHIEFIIRRVPFGNVLALQRSSEGQSLGIVQEGNTAEIKDVVPYSPAARQGLTSKTLSSDGLSLTTWFLTEINGRPLNLFFKDNEVKDRLNAVGKEISILVQPYDFIKQIKKQLKNFRSYKDYIVQ